MSNKDKMLQLVLADEKLMSLYDYNIKEIKTLEDAINSDNHIVVVIGKIIKNISRDPNKGNFKGTYNEIIDYLNKNLI